MSDIYPEIIVDWGAPDGSGMSDRAYNDEMRKVIAQDHEYFEKNPHKPWVIRRSKYIERLGEKYFEAFLIANDGDGDLSWHPLKKLSDAHVAQALSDVTLAWWAGPKGRGH